MKNKFKQEVKFAKMEKSVKFTRRHYRAIAKVLNQHYITATQVDDVAVTAVRCIVHDFEVLFQEDNARFDYEKFEKACFEL